MPLLPALGKQSRNLRVTGAWSVQWVPGQWGLHSKNLSLKQANKKLQTNRQLLLKSTQKYTLKCTYFKCSSPVWEVRISYQLNRGLFRRIGPIKRQFGQKGFFFFFFFSKGILKTFSNNIFYNFYLIVNGLRKDTPRVWRDGSVV